MERGKKEIALRHKLQPLVLLGQCVEGPKLQALNIDGELLQQGVKIHECGGSR